MTEIDIEGKIYVYDSGYSFENGSKNYRYIFKPKPWYGRQYKGLKISTSNVMHNLNSVYGEVDMAYKLLTDLTAIDEGTDSEGEAFDRILKIEEQLLPLCIKVNKPTDDELILLKKILTVTVKYVPFTTDGIIINFIKRIFLQKLNEPLSDRSRSRSPRQRSRSRSPLPPSPPSPPSPPLRTRSPRTSTRTDFFRPKKSKKQKSQSRKKKSQSRKKKSQSRKKSHKKSAKRKSLFLRKFSQI